MPKSYAAAADALMRRKLLEEMYDRMTDEEKRLFAMMTMQNKSNDEILQAIQQNQQHLQHLVEHADIKIAETSGDSGQPTVVAGS